LEIEARIAELGLELPVLPVKAGTRRVRSVRHGDLVFLAGHGPFHDGGYPFTGPVPEAISVEDARRATRYNALALLASLRGEIGDLDLVERIVKVNAYVFGVPGFNRASEVAEGCSDLLIDLYGDRGRHARSAIAVAGLALDVCCEVEMVVAVRSA
jgi:enamine deaminase RidA (YjgF/YER057c/UK114 family)